LDKGVRCGEAQNLGPQSVGQVGSSCWQGYPAYDPHHPSLRDDVTRVKLFYGGVTFGLTGNM